MMIDVTGAQMAWLNFTNVALGVVVLICMVAISVSVLRAILERRRLRMAAMGEVERDMHEMLHGDAHTFHVPSLGMTMADGGEPTKPARKDR